MLLCRPVALPLHAPSKEHSCPLLTLERDGIASYRIQGFFRTREYTAKWPERRCSSLITKGLEDESGREHGAEDTSLLAQEDLFQMFAQSPGSFVLLATVFNGALLGGALIMGQFAGGFHRHSRHK